MNRFELCSKRWIPRKAEKVQLPAAVPNTAAEEVAEPSFEDKPTHCLTEPITIYIIPTFENCTRDDANGQYSLRLNLRYSYDYSINIIFRKHTARKDYEELIKKLDVDQEYALVERGKKSHVPLSSFVPRRAPNRLLYDNVNRIYFH